VCGCLGALILIGSVFYLWDGLWHGFGDATGLALIVLALGLVSIIGWVGSRKR
jgi:hypothetical protein